MTFIRVNERLTPKQQLMLGMTGSIFGFDGPGNQGGVNERADILTQAGDGSDLNEIWTEIAATLAIWNRQRTGLIAQLTYNVGEAIEHVGVPGQTDFEEASEYGQPRGASGYTYLNRGYDFKFYDLAMRFTWMFIAEAGADQLRNLNNQALEADNRLLFNKVFKTMFNPTNLQGIADKNIPTTVVKFYNGDGEVPPIYKTNTFTGSHTHYSTTQTLGASATLNSATVDAVEADLKKHGYAPQQSGTRLIITVNPQEGAIIRTWKVTSGAKYDFIPSANYGGGIFLPMNGGIIARPEGVVDEEIGTYGPFHIVEEEYTPAGYLACLASGGEFSLNNPIGIREHSNPTYRGLTHIPGQRSDYPLIDSFYRRGFGTGIRQRGAGFIVQVTSSATYTVPGIYA
jgi:hypothetical protein